MGIINILDETLSNKIAAGEVIERPSNVVKELVENSIDAASSLIKIEIEDGGLSLIKITDNGLGMSMEDAILCFSRHATSKIRNDFDLFRISSLGFRGEAIPSIASISRFELKTCQQNHGTKVVYEFGKCLEEKDAAAKKGTEITITKLFQNVPARLKYMKSVNSEFSSIQGFVEKLSLSYPNISFVLYHQSKLIFKSNGNGNLLEVIHNIYGLNVVKNLIPIDVSNDEFRVSGYISKIELSRSNKRYIHALVNNRVVKSALVIEAVNDVYRKYLFPNRFPVAFLNVEIDPYLVDVNVHPAKLEVRFSKEQALKELLEQGLANVLKEQDLTYSAPIKKNNYPKEKTVQQTFEFNSNYEKEKLEESNDFVSEHVITKTQPMIKETVETYKINHEIPKISNNMVEELAEKIEEIKPIKVVKPRDEMFVKGQVHGTYIIAENEKGMYIIDQHAAKERVNYEYYIEKFSKLDLSMQELLIPMVLEYPQSEWNLLNEKKELLLEVGIRLEAFGNQSFVVKELPIWMKQIDEHLYIEEMIQQILHKQKIDLFSLRKDAIATLSCKASIKGNTYLDQKSLQSIVDELLKSDNPYVCPHGRPVIISYSTYEIEKMFKRII